LKDSNADKSITWDQPFPNFNEQDVLIIDLNTLTDEILGRIEKLKLRIARDQIFNKFVNGGTIIFITAPFRSVGLKAPTISNYYLSPISFTVTNVEGKRIELQQNNELCSSYLSKIDSFSYYLHDFKISQSFMEIEPTNDLMSTIQKSIENQYSGPRNKLESAEPLDLVNRKLASDNSNNAISVECWLKVDGYWDSGNAIYLPSPPSSRISISDAIDLILEKSGKSISSPILPDWANNLFLSTVDDLTTGLSTLLSKREEVNREIKELEDKIKSTQKYRRLLSSKDKLLVKIVADAFRFLGIQDIREKGGADEEDLIFQFRHATKFKFGVLEIHGTDGQMPLQKLVQCNRWVEDYLLKGNHVKGIVISNQFIPEPYPQSKDKRIRYEPNQLEYIKNRDMCVIPSCVLFEAVNSTLSGAKPSREALESIIANSKHVIDVLR
jgi:hypothetical protein